MNLEVLIPFLLPPAALGNEVVAPAATSLEYLLTRSDVQRRPVDAAHSAICDRWGLNSPYPLAPLLAAFDGHAPADFGWLFAEPAHFRADRSRVTIFPAHYLDVEAHEADELIATISRHFPDDSLAFSRGTADRWYVRCQATEIPVTTPIEAARSGSLAELQPQATGRINWWALQNEIQMLFHDHPVNKRRDERGKATINGVWLWGGGVMPGSGKPDFDRVITDSPLAVQLSRMSEIDYSPFDGARLFHGTGTTLLFLDDLARLVQNLELDLWRDKVQALDASLFQPIRRAVSTGLCKRLTIRTHDFQQEQVFALSPGQHFFRTLRRRKPLSAFFLNA